MHLTYTFLYYIAAGLALASTPLLFYKFGKYDGFLIKKIIIVFVCFVYLVGMFRQDGVDYSGYVYSYYNDHTYIPDSGFRALMFSFDSLGLPFEALMFLVATVNILSLRRAAKYFAISFEPLFIIYFLHLAIVRDFSQLRVGFAIALAIFCVTSSGRSIRLIFLLLAGSMHLTSLVFIFSYEFCRWVELLKSQRKQILSIVGLLFGIFLMGSFVNHLSFIDPRVESYILWTAKDYGLPVGQFLLLFFHTSILLLAYYTRESWVGDVKIQTLLFLQILGLAVFIAFTNVSIFAFRLSSATLSFYPVLLIFSLSHLRLRINNYSISKILASILFILLGVVLILRSDSIEIIRAINFGD